MINEMNRKAEERFTIHNGKHFILTIINFSFSHLTALLWPVFEIMKQSVIRSVLAFRPSVYTQHIFYHKTTNILYHENRQKLLWMWFFKDFQGA